MRLNRFLARCGWGSRRSVEALVLAGRVRVDGVTASHPGLDVPDGTLVEVDGRRVDLPPESTTIAFHKPIGLLTSRGDTHGRPTVYDALPEAYSRLHYVGRLDQDSRGLLLFTDDGTLTHALTHPSFQVERVYEVMPDAPLGEAERQALLTGVDLGEGAVGRCSAVEEMGGGRLRLTMREGKKREIRRMLAGVGRGVVDLLRVAYGGVRLADLPEGQFRPLSANEIRALQHAVESGVPNNRISIREAHPPTGRARRSDTRPLRGGGRPHR